MPDRIAANRRASALLLGAPTVVLLVLGLLVGLLVGAPVAVGLGGLVLGVVAAAAAALVSDRLALRLAGARPAPASEQPRLHNLVEGLCASAGVPPPALYVVADDSPNAMAVGRRPRHASIVVTSGLLSTLERIELEGVVAHELAHLRNHDVVPATLAVPLLGVFLPLTAGLLERVVPSTREADADLAAVRLTRYPPGLAKALARVGAAPPSRVHRAVAHLWLRPPGDDLASRVTALRDL